MASITADWQGEMVFDVIDDAGIPVDVDGSQRIGVKPSQLLPMALATCSGVDVVQVLAEGPARLASLTVTARSFQDPDPPWIFTRIKVHYRVGGTGLTDEIVAEAIHRSHTEMCSVAATIQATTQIESTFEIVPGTGAVPGS